MAGTCGAMFAKIILIVFNGIFLCAGLVLIAVGIWIVADPNIIEPIKLLKGAFGASFLRNASILLITMGVIVVFVTALGFFAAIKENVIALSVYLGLLCLVCFGEIAGGVVAIVFKDRAIDQIQNSLYEEMVELAIDTNQSYYKVNNKVCSSNDISKLIDYVQVKFDCCGIRGYQDYNAAFNFTTSYTCGINDTAAYSTNVPLSCCLPRQQSSDLMKDELYADIYSLSSMVNCTNNNYFQQGCETKMVSFISRYAPVIIGIGLGFGFLELFGIIFTVCLCQNPDKDY